MKRHNEDEQTTQESENTKHGKKSEKKNVSDTEHKSNVSNRINVSILISGTDDTEKKESNSSKNQQENCSFFYINSKTHKNTQQTKVLDRSKNIMMPEISDMLKISVEYRSIDSDLDCSDSGSISYAMHESRKDYESVIISGFDGITDQTAKKMELSSELILGISEQKFNAVDITESLNRLIENNFCNIRSHLSPINLEDMYHKKRLFWFFLNLLIYGEVPTFDILTCAKVLDFKRIDYFGIHDIKKDYSILTKVLLCKKIHRLLDKWVCSLFEITSLIKSFIANSSNKPETVKMLSECYKGYYHQYYRTYDTNSKLYNNSIKNSPFYPIMDRKCTRNMEYVVETKLIRDDSRYNNSRYIGISSISNSQTKIKPEIIGLLYRLDTLYSANRMNVVLVGIEIDIFNIVCKSICEYLSVPTECGHSNDSLIIKNDHENSEYNSNQQQDNSIDTKKGIEFYSMDINKKIMDVMSDLKEENLRSSTDSKQQQQQQQQSQKQQEKTENSNKKRRLISEEKTEPTVKQSLINDDKQSIQAQQDDYDFSPVENNDDILALTEDTACDNNSNTSNNNSGSNSTNTSTQNTKTKKKKSSSDKKQATSNKKKKGQ